MALDWRRGKEEKIKDSRFSSELCGSTATNNISSTLCNNATKASLERDENPELCDSVDWELVSQDEIAEVAVVQLTVSVWILMSFV